jgi:hypothetical protein
MRNNTVKLPSAGPEVLNFLHFAVSIAASIAVSITASVCRFAR